MVFGLPEFVEIVIISVLLSFVSVIVYRVSADQRAIKNIKSEMKSLNERIKKAQKEGNQKEMNKMSGELMKLSGKQFQMNMKPMMISMAIFLAAFWFLGASYGEAVIPSPISIPFVGNQLGWFHLYILIMLPGSLFFRKMLMVE